MSTQELRAAWIQFACAALTGLTPSYHRELIGQYDRHAVQNVVDAAATVANQMLAKMVRLESEGK